MFKLSIGKISLWGSILCLLGFPAALLGYRFGGLPLDLSFNIIKGTFICSFVFLIISSLICLVAIWRTNISLVKSSGLACLILIIPAGGLMTQLIKGKSLPMIHDISTDTTNPPGFEAAVALRQADDNSLLYAGEKIAKLQLAAYPHIQPIFTSVDVKQNYKKALDIATQLGWTLISQDQVRGKIEAVDTTALWAFKDDIVIQVTDTEQGSRIDLRSVSRVGLSDLGANAARIKAFTDLFQPH